MSHGRSNLRLQRPAPRTEYTERTGDRRQLIDTGIRCHILVAGNSADIRSRIGISGDKNHSLRQRHRLSSGDFVG